MSSEKMTEDVLKKFDFVVQDRPKDYPREQVMKVIRTYVSNWDINNNHLIFTELPTYEGFMVEVIKFLGKNIRDILMEEIQEHFKV